MPNPNKAHGFIAEFSLGDGQIPLFSGATRSNASFADGDALLVSGGLISIAPAGTRKIVGVAAHAVVGAVGIRQNVLFVPALETIVFSGQYGSATSLLFTQGIVWSRRNFVGATGVQRLTNGVAASTAIAWIVGLRRQSAFGTYGEAMFIWSRSAFSNRNNHTIAGAV